MSGYFSQFPCCFALIRLYSDIGSRKLDKVESSAGERCVSINPARALRFDGRLRATAIVSFSSFVFSRVRKIREISLPQVREPVVCGSVR